MSHISMGSVGSTAVPSDNNSARSAHVPSGQRQRKVCCSVWFFVPGCVFVTAQAWIPLQKGLHCPLAMCIGADCVSNSILPTPAWGRHLVYTVLMFRIEMVTSSCSNERVFATISAYNMIIIVIIIYDKIRNTVIINIYRPNHFPKFS